MLDALEKDFKERIKKNANLCNEECASEFSKFSGIFYQIPKMEDLDLVSENFFKDKIE